MWAAASAPVGSQSGSAALQQIQPIVTAAKDVQKACQNHFEMFARPKEREGLKEALLGPERLSNATAALKNGSHFVRQ